MATPSLLKNFFSLQDDWMKILTNSIIIFRSVLSNNQLTLRATSLVYTTLMALVPLIAVSFSMLKGLGAHNHIEPMLQSLFSPLGPAADELVGHLVTFVNNMRLGVLGSVGTAVLIYTIIALTHKIESAFNYIWMVERPRTLGRRFSDYLSIILVGPVLIISALGITASISKESVVQSLIAVEPLGSLLLFLGKMMPYLMVIGVFTFINSFVPNTKVRFKAALVGGIVAGTIWQTFGILFTWFVANAATQTAIYSSFAILFFFMIWVYLGWLILLFSAQVSFYFQYPEKLLPQQQLEELSHQQRREYSLQLLLLVLDHYYHHNRALTVEEISHHCTLPLNLQQQILQELCQLEILTLGGDHQQRVIPLRDPQQILVSELLQQLAAFVPATATPRLTLTSSTNRYRTLATTIATREERAIATLFGDQSLYALLDETIDKPTPLPETVPTVATTENRDAPDTTV
ncbi:MAG: YihY family inner membrane protein [Gammaproteobacteria bacterium]|nr:YihY family inner membrane protein [Gammaproteobacteria bacterium]